MGSVLDKWSMFENLARIFKKILKYTTTGSDLARAFKSTDRRGYGALFKN